MNETIEICNAFNAHALEYEQSAKVQFEIGQRLFERLSYLKINPRYVLDLGCGPGHFSKLLKKHYPNAHIIGIDLAFKMLQQSKSKQSWRKKWALVNADMTDLPFPSGLFDLVFANQVIHWSNPLASVVSELNRVMAQDGCLMFSTLGPDTFLELRRAFASVDQFAHVNEFPDMHDVGDCLLAQYFVDPVVDMERLTAHYNTLPDLLRSLKAQGVRNMNAARNPGLTGKKNWQAFQQAMSAQCVEGKFPLTHKIVYGHAWKEKKKKTGHGVETLISVDALRRTLK